LQLSFGVRERRLLLNDKVTRPTFRIEGAAFHTLEGFYDEIERALLAGQSFGRNLDAFNDILRGQFGPLPDEFEFVWADAVVSRERLGHAEAVRQLRLKLERCHPSHRAAVRAQLAIAERGEGPTVFDWLAEIIRDHPNVEFQLA
jgi:RNAse (barnase) inhibitor barstar